MRNRYNVQQLIEDEWETVKSVDDKEVAISTFENLSSPYEARIIDSNGEFVGWQVRG